MTTRRIHSGDESLPPLFLSLGALTTSCNLDDGDYAIDQLLNSGWLYEVVGQLWITTLEE